MCIRDSPNKILSNATSKVGDVLILTKPLGVGILNTAMKADLIRKETENKVIEVCLLYTSENCF